MQRTKRLNINNTFRSANLLLYNPKDYKSIMNDDCRIVDKEAKYAIFVDKLSFDKVLNLVKELDDFVIITEKPLPKLLLLEIGNNHKVTIIYKITNLDYLNDDKLYENVRFYNQVFTTGILFKGKTLDVKRLLININKLKYILDRVYIYNKSLSLRMNAFHYMHEVLARWKMNLFINYLNDEEFEYIDKNYVKYE